MRITDETALAAYGAAVLPTLLPSVTGATVLTLTGDLGAGKTALVKQLAATLGVTEVVTSPTFVVMKVYHTTHQTFTKLVHIDAYRIESPEEMAPLHLADYLADREVLLCIEWPEHIAALIPLPHTNLSITVAADDVRVVTMTCHG